MDKATNMIRRSGIRLRGASSGHTELQLLISELKTLKAVTKQLGSSQLSTSQDLLQWTTVEGNRALQDVAGFTVELNEIYNDILLDFCDSLKSFRQHFEQVLTAETHIEHLRAQSSAAESKASKLRKDLKKSMKKGAQEDVALTEERVKEAEKTSDNIQLELRERVKEAEIQKMATLRKGMIELGEAELLLAKKSVILAEARIQIAKTLPEVDSGDLQEITFSGSIKGRESVEEAKSKVSSLNIRENHVEPIISTPPPENPDLPPRYEDINRPSSSQFSYSEKGSTGRSSPPSPFAPSAPPDALQDSLEQVAPIGWKPSAL